MGAHGAGLFADDTAKDIRETWSMHFREEGDAKRATQAVLKEHADMLDDEDDGPVIWLALAVVEHRHGYDTRRVSAGARRVLDRGLGLALWEEAGPGALRARKKEYLRIAALLASPRPSPKTITVKKRRPEDCGLRVGDVFRMPLPTEGLAYFKVIGQTKDRDGVYPVVVLLDLRPPGIAQPKAFDGIRWIELRTLSTIDPNRRASCGSLCKWRVRGAPRKLVERVGRCSPTSEERALTRVFNGVDRVSWSELADVARWSFDDSVWTTREMMYERVRRLSPAEILAAADSLVAEASYPYVRFEVLGGPAATLLFNQDFARSEAMHQVANKLPRDGPALLRSWGEALWELGDRQRAEELWSQHLDGTRGTRWHEIEVQRIEMRRTGTYIRPPSDD